MKRIVGLILLFVMVLTGCNNSKTESNVGKVVNYLSGLGSYSLESKMTIKRSDKNVSLNVSVDYLSPGYYKVCFKGDSEQLIIKNDSGVFVLTPSLNKEFKFDSNWPLNSSHAYLLESIKKDIKNDVEATSTLNGTDIVIECKITHKTNQKLSKMVYTCDKDFKPKKTVFLNDNNEEIITVDFENFTPNNSLGKDIFNEKKYLNQQQEQQPNESETSLTITAGYVVDGSTLSSSLQDNSTSILCYTGEVPYTIVVSKVEVSDEVVAIENYDDFEIIDCGLCLISDNSMKFYNKDYEVVIYSNFLEIDDFINIANNISMS